MKSLLEKPFTKAEIDAVKKLYGIKHEKDYTKADKSLLKKLKEIPPHKPPHSRGRVILENQKNSKKTKKS